jgi:hypothetical protein
LEKSSGNTQCLKAGKKELRWQRKYRIDCGNRKRHQIATDIRRYSQLVKLENKNTGRKRLSKIHQVTKDSKKRMAIV